MRYLVVISGGEGYTVELLREVITEKELNKKNLLQIALKELCKEDARKLISAVKMKEVIRKLEEEGEYRKVITVDYSVYEDDGHQLVFVFYCDGRFLRGAQEKKDIDGILYYRKGKYEIRRNLVELEIYELD